MSTSTSLQELGTGPELRRKRLNAIAERVKQIEQREVGNVATHGVATILSLLVFLALTTLAADNDWRILGGCILYGSVLLVTFLASTVYHAAPQGDTKHLLRVIDHLVIYITIAVTLTTAALVIPGASSHWMLVLLGIGFVVAGFAVHWWLWKNCWTWRCELIAVCLYIGLAMLAFPIIGFENILGDRDWPAALLGFGGLLYLVGVGFYVLEDRGLYKYGHEAWHVFAILGAIAHSAAFGIVAWN